MNRPPYHKCIRTGLASLNVWRLGCTQDMPIGFSSGINHTAWMTPEEATATAYALLEAAKPSTTDALDDLIAKCRVSIPGFAERMDAEATA